MKNVFRIILTHLSIVFSVILLVLYVLNKVNPAMGFLKGKTFEVYLVIHVFFSMSTAIISITPKSKHNK